MSVPTSTHIIESAVIKAPFSNVWTLIKLPRFAEWWSALDKSEIVKGVSDEADVYKFTFKVFPFTFSSQQRRVRKELILLA